MERFIEWLRKVVMHNQSDKSPEKPASGQRLLMRRLLILALAGISLLVIGKLFTHSSETDKTAQNVLQVNESKQLSAVKTKITHQPAASSIEDYQASASKNLEAVLDQMAGVSGATVLITFASTEKAIFQDNTHTQDNQTIENDQKGGTRQVNERDQDSQVVMVEKDGSKQPVVIGKQQPTVRGAIVVARGVNQPAIRAEIMEAVATVLDIPDYKVKVLPKE
ncbi:MAG: stage III sporulation protein AG [Sporolactobacillus sp.]